MKTSEITSVDKLKQYLAQATKIGDLRKSLSVYAPDLLQDIESSWRYDFPPSKFIEMIYQFLNPTDIICPYGNRRRFEFWSTGYVSCGRSCQCAKEKRTQTMIEKYGVKHALQSEEVKNKFKHTLEERYGADNLNTAFSQQRRQTNKLRYGVEHPLQSSEIREKTQETLKKNTGYHTNFHNPEIQELSRKYFEENKEKILERRNQTHYTKNPEWYDYDRIDQLLKTKTRNEVAQELECSISYIDKVIRDQDWKHHKGKPSYYEVAIEGLLIDLGVSYVKNTRKVIPPKELDFYDRDNQIAIEFCGTRWHGERYERGKFYHLDKNIRCNEKGIRLITIFQDEWDNRPEVVRDIISRLYRSPSNRVFARNTDLISVDNQSARKFYDRYHLQGYIGSSVNLGLIYQDEIIAMMSWRRGMKSDTMELTRYCVKPDLAILGGPEKLFSHWKKQQTDKVTCFTYSDNRWFTGDVYKRLGFQNVSDGAPGYWYTTGTSRMHRLNFTKSKLVKEGYDPELTEWEIMQSRGYDRMWDCGHTKWIYNQKEEK